MLAILVKVGHALRDSLALHGPTLLQPSHEIDRTFRLYYYYEETYFRRRRTELMAVSLNIRCPHKVHWMDSDSTGQYYCATLAVGSIAVICAHQSCPSTADEYDYWWSHCCIKMKWLARLQEHLSDHSSEGGVEDFCNWYKIHDTEKEQNEWNHLRWMWVEGCGKVKSANMVLINEWVNKCVFSCTKEAEEGSYGEWQEPICPIYRGYQVASGMNQFLPFRHRLK